MKKTDLAYMAGLFDGEGTVSLVNYSISKNKNVRLQVCLSSTDEWVCQSLKMMFGGGIVIKQMASETNRKCWMWYVSAITAYRMLVSVFPYLRIKRPQAEIAIKFQESINNRNRRKIDEKELVIRQAQSILVKSMNRGERMP